MTVIEGDVPTNELDKFVKQGACGTAAVISLQLVVSSTRITLHVFYSENRSWSQTRQVIMMSWFGIQFGDIEAPGG